MTTTNNDHHPSTSGNRPLDPAFPPGDSATASRYDPDTSPVTQIVYLAIAPAHSLADRPGSVWAAALDLAQRHDGFRRLYWGRSAEEPTQVQLHIVRDTLAQHRAFQSSPQYADFTTLLNSLSLSATPTTPLRTRHAALADQTPNNPSLGRHLTPSPSSPSPSHTTTTPTLIPSGSAIYVGTTPVWDSHAWPLWTHIVRGGAAGCLGIAGGPVLEPVDGFVNAYLVYVGWADVAAHEAYHASDHYAKWRVVLSAANRGWREYGHVVFEGAREGEAVGKL